MLTRAIAQSHIPSGLVWVQIPEDVGRELWATGLQKGTLRDPVDGCEVVCVSLIWKAGAKSAPKYVKRVPKPGGGYRYYYAAQQGGGVHNAAHFQAGASFAHDGGHLHIQHVGPDGMLHVEHSARPGQTVQMTHGELSQKLQEHHAPAIEAHRKKVLANFLGAIKDATGKNKAALEKKAGAYGYRPEAPAAEKKPTATEIHNDIKRNVDEHYAGKIDRDEFTKRQQGHWDRAEKHGLTNQVAKMAKDEIDAGKRPPRLSDEEHVALHDEMSALEGKAQRAQIIGKNAAPLTPAESGRLEELRRKLGLGERGKMGAPTEAERMAAQRTMIVRQKQRDAKAAAAATSAAKPAVKPDPMLDEWSGGAPPEAATPAPEATAKKPEPAASQPEIPTTKVEHELPSTNLKRVSWEPDKAGSQKGTMRVHFKNGGVYDYAGVHHNDYKKVTDSPGSHGAAFTEHIRDLHPATKLRGADTGALKREHLAEASQHGKDVTAAKQRNASVAHAEKTAATPAPKAPEAPKAEPPPAPKPEVAAPATPPHEAQYVHAQDTYGLSDKEMQTVRRLSEPAVKAAHEKAQPEHAKALIRDAVNRMVAGTRNMSPSQATKWMRKQEGDKVTKALSRLVGNIRSRTHANA